MANVYAGFLSTSQSVTASHVLPNFSSFGGSYSDENGSTLTSLAQSSVIDAKNAVRIQDSVGRQADYNAKSSLAKVAAGVKNILINFIYKYDWYIIIYISILTSFEI